MVAGGAAVVALRPDRRVDHLGGDASEPLRPYCMALHLHACYSEGPGSMEAQLAQATRSGVDVVWWTEHDQRMTAHGYREWVHFDGMTETENDQAWSWAPKSSGKPSQTRNDFVTDVASPRDASRPGSLLLGVTSSGDPSRHELLAQSAQYLYRTSLDGQTIELDVRPEAVSADAFVALEITTSYRPARAGRPAGVYVLSYRIGGGRTPGSAVDKDQLGIITVDGRPGEWTTLRVTPANDLAALWPGVDGRDAALFELRLVAVAQSGEASAHFDGLHFIRRANSKQQPLRTQTELANAYEAQFPTVRQIQAVELSLITPHIGWYGGKLTLPDHHGEGAAATVDPADALAAVRAVHAAGGLASYNHPFGTETPKLNEAQQDKARRVKSAELISNKALGCELLEVGYRLRGGCTLDRHVSVWDNSSRNGIFLTGTGVSDDHKGKDWLNQQLNFVTWVWAASDAEPDLLDALRRGRAYFGDPAHFRGRLDLMVDGKVPMGAVSVADDDKRQLAIHLDGLPDGGRVQVIRGDVDFAGPEEVDPKLDIRELTASDFDRAGRAKVTVDTGASRFVRVTLVTSDNLPVAYSNPVWLMKERPNAGIPIARQV